MSVVFKRLCLGGLAVVAACSATGPGQGTDPVNTVAGTAPSPVVGGHVGGSTASAGSGSGGAPVGSAGQPPQPGAGTGGASAVAGSGPGGGGSGGWGGAMYPTDRAMPASATASWVYVKGYQLMVGKRGADGVLEVPAPYKIKGVGWSPTGVGEGSGAYASFYTKYAGQDVPLMGELHANTVKTYDAFQRSPSGKAVLDALYAQGIMVILQVMSSIDQQDSYLQTVTYFKDHPAVLMWQVGNELNYNNLYGAADYAAAVAIVKKAVDDIHAADKDHPVAVSFGEVPTKARHDELSAVDVWSINIYPGLDFANRFNNWVVLSKKPMFVGEYGADAWDTTKNQENQAAQAEATTKLTQLIMAALSADDPAKGVLGGTIYSLTDEWWKGGNADSHDHEGFQNAIYPDNVANEEWWGILTIERTKRQAFTALQTLYAQ